MYLIGLDIGSSSVKTALLNGETGECIASTHHPKTELSMIAHHLGWAEQEPEVWWTHAKAGIKEIVSNSGVKKDDILAIGISYQMHGLVIVDKDQQVLRPSIIWCDSRAVDIGNKAFRALGEEFCLGRYLNSPGNFTASKLRWVKENEGAIFEKIHKVMLPGDYIAMKLSGEINTTYTGLSEGIMWDFTTNGPANTLLEHYQIPEEFLPETHPSFHEFGIIKNNIAEELGLSAKTKITYKAGDQPNNALSLNVLEPGEIAATAGTSGVVYGVSAEVSYDPKSRVNTFAHVNHSAQDTRLGILLCINGTGILNNWLNKNVSPVSYEEMNQMAGEVSPGSDGLLVFPFGNGAERMLENRLIGSQFRGLDFNRHQTGHLIRASHEGIAFSFVYGMKIMENLGIKGDIIRAGMGNMFLSPIFKSALSCTAEVGIELYNTDGAQGAARAAGIGIGYFQSPKDAFQGLSKIGEVQPDSNLSSQYKESYQNWEDQLRKEIAVDG